MTDSHIQLDALDSYKKYRKRLMSAVDGNLIGNIDEYTVDSVTGRDIAELYRKIIQDALGASVKAEAKEISDGKYELLFSFDESMTLALYCKGWDSEELITDNMMRNIIRPYIEQRSKRQ